MLLGVRTAPCPFTGPKWLAARGNEASAGWEPLAFIKLLEGCRETTGVWLCNKVPPPAASGVSLEEMSEAFRMSRSFTAAKYSGRIHVADRSHGFRGAGFPANPRWFWVGTAPKEPLVESAVVDMFNSRLPPAAAREVRCAERVAGRAPKAGSRGCERRSHNGGNLREDQPTKKRKQAGHYQRKRFAAVTAAGGGSAASGDKSGRSPARKEKTVTAYPPPQKKNKTGPAISPSQLCPTASPMMRHNEKRAAAGWGRQYTTSAELTNTGRNSMACHERSIAAASAVKTYHGIGANASIGSEAKAWIMSMGGTTGLPEEVLAQLSGSAACISASEWVECRMQSNLTPNAMKSVVGFVKKTLGKKSKASGRATAGHGEMADFEASLPCPKIERVPGAPLTCADRVMRHDVGMSSLLGARKLQKYLEFRQCRETGRYCVDSTLALDKINVTRARSLTLGFSALLSMKKKYKTAAGAMLLSYVGEHDDGPAGAGRATSALLSGTSHEISYQCCGPDCALPGCDGSANATHTLPHTLWLVDDMKAALATCGLQQNVCIRGLTKFGAGPTGKSTKEMGWNDEGFECCDRMEDSRLRLEAASKSFYSEWAEWVGVPLEGCTSLTQKAMRLMDKSEVKRFMKTKAYDQWKKRSTPHIGPCAASNLGDLFMVRVCMLHAVMDLTNAQFKKTWCRLARELEFKGKGGVRRLCEAMRAVGLGWWATKILRKYEELAAKSKAGAAEQSMHSGGTAGFVDLARSYAASIKTKEGLVNELRDLGLRPATKEKMDADPGAYADYTKDGWPKIKVAKTKLEYYLVAALKRKRLAPADLRPGTSRLRLGNGSGGKAAGSTAARTVRTIAEDAHAVIVGQESLSCSSSDVDDLLTDGADIMGSDCITLLENWHRIPAYMDENVSNLAVSAAIAKRQANKEHSALQRKLDSARDRAKYFEYCDHCVASVGGAIAEPSGACECPGQRPCDDANLYERELRALEQAQAEAEGADRDQLTASMDGIWAELRATSQDEAMCKDLSDNWDRFTGWLLPLAKGKMPESGKKLREGVRGWHDHFLDACGGQLQGQYVHYWLKHGEYEADRLASMGLTFGDFTAQRSELCNKLVKLRILNLFAFMGSTGGKTTDRNAVEVVMQERARKIIHYPDTIHVKRTEVCRICSGDHRCTNQRYHPIPK